MTINTWTSETPMNPNQTEIAAAWIVALALMAAIVVHLFLPATPPRLGHGVADAASVRVQRSLPGGSAAPDSDVPLVEHGDGRGARARGAPAESGSVSPVIPPVLPRPAE